MIASLLGGIVATPWARAALRYGAIALASLSVSVRAGAVVGQRVAQDTRHRGRRISLSGEREARLSGDLRNRSR